MISRYFLNCFIGLPLILVASLATADKAPFVASDHQALLASDDPQLAANKQLVYDMYREVLIAGRAGLVEQYFTEEYIQHNPNVQSGRDSLANYVSGSRPERSIPDKVTLPLISMVAEGDKVLIAFVRTEQDDEGNDYYTSWFDLFRIEDGRIAEHWDPALKSPDAVSMDPNKNKPVDQLGK